LQLTNGHGADLIVDVGGKDTLDQSVKSLADAGSLSIVGGLSGYDGNISAWGLLKKSARAQGVFVGSRADYLRMNAFIAEKKLHPVLDRVLPLEQFDEALKALQSGSFVGKIVLTL
jgi:NADPH:quinone reductase-like Zn-dependent oxidoreductase